MQQARRKVYQGVPGRERQRVDDRSQSQSVSARKTATLSLTFLERAATNGLEWATATRRSQGGGGAVVGLSGACACAFADCPQAGAPNRRGRGGNSAPWDQREGKREDAGPSTFDLMGTQRWCCGPVTNKVPRLSSIPRELAVGFRSVSTRRMCPGVNNQLW